MHKIWEPMADFISINKSGYSIWTDTICLLGKIGEYYRDVIL